MRRKDREMDTDFALYVVDKCEYAVLSMVNIGGLPYCVPVSIVRDGENIFIHSAMEGYKVNCLRNNANVCISCVGDTRRLLDDFTTEYESAIIKGNATEVTDGNAKVNALKLLCERHTPTNMSQFDTEIERSLNRTAVWQIKISSITAKRKIITRADKE